MTPLHCLSVFISPRLIDQSVSRNHEDCIFCYTVQNATARLKRMNQGCYATDSSGQTHRPSAHSLARQTDWQLVLVYQFNNPANLEAARRWVWSHHRQATCAARIADQIEAEYEQQANKANSLDKQVMLNGIAQIKAIDPNFLSAIKTELASKESWVKADPVEQATAVLAFYLDNSFNGLKLTYTKVPIHRQHIKTDRAA